MSDFEFQLTARIGAKCGKEKKQNFLVQMYKHKNSKILQPHSKKAAIYISPFDVEFMWEKLALTLPLLLNAHWTQSPPFSTVDQLIERVTMSPSLKWKAMSRTALPVLATIALLWILFHAFYMDTTVLNRDSNTERKRLMFRSIILFIKEPSVVIVWERHRKPF